MEGRERAVKVLVVEDDEWMRDSIRHALEWPSTGLVHVGSADCGSAALELIKGGIDPDVALVDMGLPDMPGTDVIRALRKSKPRTAAIVFTIVDDRQTILSALRAGAQGYLLKSAPIQQVLDGLRTAVDGGSPMTPSVARLVVEEVRAKRPDPESICPGLQALTKRETEVLTLLAKGLTYAETGKMLGIGLGTVQGHVKRIYEKLHVDSKAEAATLAQRMGLL